MPGKVQWCSKQCKEKHGNLHKIITTSFSDNPNVWFGPHRKEFAINKLGNACEKCCCNLGKNEIHHIDGNPKYNPMNGSNWIMLCKKCHLWVHRQGRKCGHYLSRDEIISMTYEPWVRVRKKNGLT